MTDTTALAIVSPQQYMRRATDVAGVCREIVLRTAKVLGNRKFVPVEGWQAIATAHGCSLSIDLVEVVDKDIRAVASVRTHTGVMLCQAEGFVGADEKTWANRPMYARRAMAQTRAMSRAARSAFAHVVVLISNDLSTTPAEEMGADDDHQAPAPRPTVVPVDAAAPSPAAPVSKPPIDYKASMLATSKQAVEKIGRDRTLSIMSTVVGKAVARPIDIPADKYQDVTKALQLAMDAPRKVDAEVVQ